MCRRNNNETSSKRRSSSSFLLLTHDSFVFPELDRIDKDDANKSLLSNNSKNVHLKKNPHIYGLGGPTLYATLATVAFYVTILFGIEYGTNLLLRHFTAHIPLLNESPHNVGILARHLSVDFLSLLVCVYISISNRHVCSEIIEHFYLSMGKKSSHRCSQHSNKTNNNNNNNNNISGIMHESGYEERIFQYHPGAQRLITFFLVYQVKNLYDTLYWNDGVAFVLHHIFAGAAAWGGMFPGCCHFYSIFYFGFSEISTAILCLLANFDPKYGIPGLDEAFPKTKLILGLIFVLSFIVCRLILWPYATYFFARDTLAAMKSNVPRVHGRRGYLRIIYSCCVFLTLIQLLFVGMIVQTGKEEFEKFMKTL